MSENLKVTQDVKGFEAGRYNPSRKPKTTFKSDVLWRNEPSLSVKAKFCLFTGVEEKDCFRNNFTHKTSSQGPEGFG